MKWLSVLLILMFVSHQPKSVEGKVVEYCKNHFGKKVGTGECWDLANEALNYAGAKWEAPLNFGELTKDMKPGYILQFTDVKFKGTNYSASFPQHTAIVSKYKTKGNLLTIYQQNYNNKRKVDTLTLNLNDLVSGKIESFRPIGK